MCVFNIPARHVEESMVGCARWSEATTPPSPPTHDQNTAFCKGDSSPTPAGNDPHIKTYTRERRTKNCASKKKKRHRPPVLRYALLNVRFGSSTQPRASAVSAVRAVIGLVIAAPLNVILVKALVAHAALNVLTLRVRGVVQHKCSVAPRAPRGWCRPVLGHRPQLAHFSRIGAVHAYVCLAHPGILRAGRGVVFRSPPEALVVETGVVNPGHVPLLVERPSSLAEPPSHCAPRPSTAR